VLLNKVVLDQVPKHGPALIEEVQKWGRWMAEAAEKELRAVYPADDGGRQPVAYLWARTIQCEGPACGMRVPLLKSGWVAKRGGRLVAVRLRPIPKERRVEFELETPRSASEARPGTISGAHVLCPACGFTTKKDRVRAQLRERHGGVDDAVLYCVALASVGGDGRTFRLPTDDERTISTKVRDALTKCASDVPDEPIPQERVWKNNPIRVHLYGVDRWSRLFTPRQRLLMATYCRLAREASSKVLESTRSPELAAAVED
jgi:putative DNA methylase